MNGLLYKVDNSEKVTLLT